MPGGGQRRLRSRAGVTVSLRGRAALSVRGDQAGGRRSAPGSSAPAPR
jgi:hypothetical protein